jgi:hypothetical protein
MNIGGRTVRSLFILALGLLSASQASHGESPSRAPTIGEEQAAKIAEDSFLKVTQHRVTEYLKHVCRTHKAAESCFLFEGEGRFSRPGQDWIVIVNRKTGKTEVLFGQ